MRKENVEDEQGKKNGDCKYIFSVFIEINELKIKKKLFILLVAIIERI